MTKHYKKSTSYDMTSDVAVALPLLLSRLTDLGGKSLGEFPPVAYLYCDIVKKATDAVALFAINSLASSSEIFLQI